MNSKAKEVCKHILTVVVFLGACWLGFYAIYWGDLTDAKPQDSKIEMRGNLTFTGDVKRFLTVYFTQDFGSDADRINFVGQEALRFADYSLTDEKDLVLRNVLMKNLEEIIVKAGDMDYNTESENANLKQILNQLP